MSPRPGVWWTPHRFEGLPLPKPNYAFEKRQRELEKQRKKTEKAQRKAESGNTPPATPTPADDKPPG